MADNTQAIYDQISDDVQQLDNVTSAMLDKTSVDVACIDSTLDFGGEDGIGAEDLFAVQQVGTKIPQSVETIQLTENKKSELEQTAAKKAAQR